MPIFRNPDVEHCSLLPLYLTTAGIQNRQPPTNRPNGAPFHHIFFVEQGECVFETASGRKVLPAGTVVFIRKELPIRYYAHGDTLLTGWVTFDGFGASSLFSYFQAKDFSYISNATLYPRILSIYHHAEKRLSHEQLSKEVYDLVISYFDELKAASCPRALAQAKRFIGEHSDNDLSVSDIAESVGISPSLLYRLFREHEGISPIQSVRRIRIQKAKQLLLSEHPILVRNVAAQCGFSDTAYFCKIFREETGLSPTAFRAIHDTFIL